MTRLYGWGPTDAQLLGTGFASMSYWQWYFPKRYWNRTSGVEVYSPADYVNDRITSKNGTRK